MKHLTLFFLVSLSVFTMALIYQCEAQLVDIDIKGPVVVIGEQPRCVGEGVYLVRHQWSKMAVYLDGHRCLNYRANPAAKEITFNCPTNRQSVVVVDYLQ